ncbi:hypothetical protein [uncultured Polaribacter sp.]|uniref:tetratricopeptide repeat-containing sensor histidine kinase n=1 Tax=uncultured Polaribacter sp. TaxID=174711 RepID=UPI002623B34E|nr:hypothetical protein [uncultured Polaribacter sp.]
MKKLTLLALFLITFCAFGQSNKKIDSLKKVLQGTTNNVAVLNKISVLYQRQNIDSALFYAKKSVSISEKAKHKLLPESLTGLAIAYWYKGKLDSAQYFIEKTLVSDKLILDSLLWAKNNCNLAILLSNKGNYNDAIKKYTNGNSYFLAKKDSVQVYKTHINIAILYNTIREYNLAYEENTKALHILKNLKNQEYLPRVYNNIGLNLIDLKREEESLQVFNKGLVLAQKQSNKLDEAIILGNLGYIKVKLKRFAEARKHIQESLELVKEVNTPDTKIKNLLSLAELELATKNLNSANKVILQVEREIELLKLANSFVAQTTDTQLLLLKSNLFLAERKYEEAFTAKEKWVQITDSIKSVEFSNRISKYKSNQEAQQKENEILKLKNESQAKELLIQQSKTKTNYAIASIFLVVLGGGLYLRKRKKDQKFKLLEESIKSSELEKIRIGKDLHDGIASKLRLLAHDFETKDVETSHKLLDSYTEIRNLSHQLNNTPIHGEVFMDRLYEIVPKNTENKLFEVQIEPPYLELKEPYSTHLFRISQELFTNNLKYAKASKTIVKIRLNDNYLQLNYSDNGIGSSDLKKGNGLNSIEDRVTLLKGDLTIDVNSGFTVRITIPYKN